MSELVLYVADPASVKSIGVSPPSWMCAAVLLHKGIAHRVVKLSFERGEHRSSEMLARNPRGTIPVLTEGSVVVHETLAVMTYLELRTPGLLPGGGALGLAATRFFEADYVKSAGMAALRYVMQIQGVRDSAVIAEHRRALGAELARWDTYAADGYVAGASLTMADFVIYPYVATFRRLGLSLAPWPHLSAHHDRLADLPAFAATRPASFDEPIDDQPFASS